MIDPKSLDKFDESQLVRFLVKENGLREFMCQFWDYAQPGVPFKNTWAVGALCEFLEAISRRQIVDGIISMPPRHCKSLSACVFLEPWVWTWQPWHRFLLGNWSARNLSREAKQTQSIVFSELYRTAFPEVVIPDRDGPMLQLTTSKNGVRYATTTGVPPTGEGGHTRIFDDPMPADEKRSKNRKAAVSDWWFNGMATRRAGGLEFASLGIMQRLAHDDLSGECLDQGYEHLCLPLEYVPNAWWDRGTTLGPLDERTEPGELLMPEVWDETACKGFKDAIKNPSDRAAQLQQNPVPDTGGIVERGWFKRWTTDEANKEERLPPENIPMRWITSWDLGFEGEDESHSRVAAVLMAKVMIAGLPRYFVVQAEASHMNYPETKLRFRKLTGGWKDERKKRERYTPPPLWQNARCHVVEKKANGHALIAELRNEIPGLQVVTPKDSKGDRLIVHSDRIRAGELWLPPSAVCPQIVELENELVFFPNGDYDDFVDVVTQGLDELAGPVGSMRDDLARLMGRRK